MSKKNIDITNWERREHFEFFKEFNEPFWGVVSEVDASQAYNYAKTMGYSFFLYYLYKSLEAANRVDAFKMRIEEDQVVMYDHIHSGSTINRPDGTFGFSHIHFSENIHEFFAEAQEEIERVRSSRSLFSYKNTNDVIHYSSLPWIRFSGLSHARRFSNQDSCPKITFGKMTEASDKKWLPISIHVHHALVDGLQVGQYLEVFQNLLNDSNT